MQLAPIVLFVYNRSAHTKATLEALKANVLANQSELYVYADGPKINADKNDIEKIKEVREIVKSDAWCKRVTLIEREENKGLANSIINGVTEIVNRFGTIIVLEDDLVTSPFFLKYMNEALNLYELENDVACISGYVYPVKGTLPSTFFIRGTDCWGWATWKRAWADFELDGAKLLNELQARDMAFEFNFNNSYDYIQMLSDQIDGKNNSWAIRWYASAFLKNKLCLYPGESYIQNIGTDGTGTHSGNSKRWETKLNFTDKTLISIKPHENLFARKKISGAFKNGDKKKYIFNLLVSKIFKKVRIVLLKTHCY